ncbi:MAG: phosphate ABC transporter permease PstA [Eubacteriales bacterium]|jgi:phosphate transport system permease protein|nr:phosphate ABC transporter permease PstA [Bacillota bacterium]MBV1726956.1 phosphate ABC transporter permease PstA [Desulforudis sp.]MDQ7789475.1 phosphate ABC transporter permease PstA [Clostridia bacterium]MDZ4044035.1 phosphate ABC transporter permease PstA [Eubacteriales bacterium]MBU4534000.1 phosphate ABC transporter permease PstA [Bacillota bacterium]
MNSNRLSNTVATVILWASGFFIVGLLVFFLAYILGQGFKVLSLDFVFGPASQGGVGPQLFNTFYILVLSLLYSVPIGVGAGIYLAEYAKPSRLTNLVRLSTECLATVPSIVLGLFGLIIFVNVLGLGFTILGGAAALALLNLPVLVRVTEEALRTVPHAHREGSLALGSTQWQTIRRVVLPSSILGLITGITLVSGRAIGEAAILVFTAGTSVSRHYPDFNPLVAGETLAVHLWYVRGEPLVANADAVAAGSAALLVLVVLFFNLAIGLPARIYQRRLRGSN